MAVVVSWRCRHLKNPQRATAGERLVAFRAAIPGLITPVIILGGIYAGLLTPSESAAAAGVWAILIGIFVYRELTLRGIIQALHETARITAIIFAIIAMATFLSVVLTYSKAPQHIIGFFTDFGGTPLTFWISVAIICLILGTFIEIIPVFYLTVPIFAALALSLGQDILHLYVVFVAFAGIGMITPPVCVGIYTAAGVAKESPGEGVSRSASVRWSRDHIRHPHDSVSAGGDMAAGRVEVGPGSRRTRRRERHWNAGQSDKFLTARTGLSSCSRYNSTKQMPDIADGVGHPAKTPVQ